MTPADATVFVVDDDPSVCKALGRLIKSAGFNIVFITAHENGMAKTKAMAAEAVAFFQKPFYEKDLLGAIHKALDLNNT